MIKRIVKLTFKTEYVDEFKELFASNQSAIVAFEGCHHLELWQDQQHSNLFFTYSLWDSVDHLNSYRNSLFFKKIWQQTKTKFENKAEAWTVAAL